MTQQGSEDNWERSKGDPCPCCGREMLRVVGRTCHHCAMTVPDQVAAFLQKFRLPATVVDNEARADLLGHTLNVSFSPEKSALYICPGSGGDRRLFQGLARELERWAGAKGLSLMVGRGPSPGD